MIKMVDWMDFLNTFISTFVAYIIVQFLHEKLVAKTPEQEREAAIRKSLKKHVDEIARFYGSSDDEMRAVLLKIDDFHDQVVAKNTEEFPGAEQRKLVFDKLRIFRSQVNQVSLARLSDKGLKIRVSAKELIAQCYNIAKEWQDDDEAKSDDPETEC